MSNHGYQTKNNTRLTENQTPQQAKVSLISLLESKLLSSFDSLSTEFRNLKDIIIKRLQIENERLRKRVSYLSKRIVSLEYNHNMLKQYVRQNNIEVTRTPNTVQDNELENKVIEIFNAISVETKSADFEDCYRVGKSKNKNSL